MEWREDEAVDSGSYDQFAANRVDHSFDETMYTSYLDTDHPEYEAMRKEAATEEERIMRKEAVNKHVRDDRAYYLQRENGQCMMDGDGDEDEEDAFSRVISCESCNDSF